MNNILYSLGFHNIKKGLGWANGKRFDACLNCKYCMWIPDEKGYKEFNSGLNRIKRK